MYGTSSLSSFAGVIPICWERNQRSDRPKKNSQIGPESSPVEILELGPQFLVQDHVDIPVVPVSAREQIFFIAVTQGDRAGHSRPDIQNTFLFGAVILQVLFVFRTRA